MTITICKLKEIREKLFYDFLRSELFQGTAAMHFSTFTRNNPEAVVDWLTTGQLPGYFFSECIVTCLELCKDGRLVGKHKTYNFLPLIDFLWEYAEDLGFIER
jgi:hypothetical protein